MPKGTEIDSESAVGLKGTAQSIQEAWRGLFDPDAADIHRPTDLMTQWGLDQTMCIRLFQALREPEPLLALRSLPAAPSLRTVLRAAGRAGVSKSRVAAASLALSDLEGLIRAAGGTKSMLDTLVARHFRHTRERVETGAKQMIHRGNSNLLGVDAATSIVMCFVYPGADPEWCDELVIHGYRGLRRLRPELPLVLGSREILEADGEEARAATLRTLNDGRIAQAEGTTALEPFCSDPMPTIDVRPDGDKRLLYVLAEAPEELPRSIDLFFGSVHRSSDPRCARQGHERARYALIPQNPSRDAVFDVYVHRDLWKDVDPSLVIAKVGNPAAPDLLAHSLDQADFVEELQRLGDAPTSITTPVYPEAGRLHAWIHDEMDWELGAFRQYRCQIRYPVVGIWYTIQFLLPPR